jgi:hypothetical protein
MVAIIPVEMYERLIAEREARFRVLDRIRGRLPEVPPEEVERDVAEAVAAVRAPTRGRIRSCGGRTGGNSEDRKAGFLLSPQQRALPVGSFSDIICAEITHRTNGGLLQQGQAWRSHAENRFNL